MSGSASHLARRAPRPALAVLAALALAACDVSQEEEVQLGEETARQVQAELPLVTDPVADRYLDSLGGAIAASADARGLDWHFSIVDAPEVNAFALPGGHIYINRGLIERAQSLSQLAGVLGHEIAHVTERHSVEQLRKQQGASLGVGLVCTLTSLCESGLAQAAINLGGSAWFARHSREDEAEADSVGIEHVIRAGIDPRGVPQMFEILLAERRESPGLVQGWFGTHPLEEERVQRTRTIIDERIDPAALEGLVEDTEAFHAFRERVRSLPPSPPPRVEVAPVP